jgi:uncharacterized YigZ family protein
VPLRSVAAPARRQVSVLGSRFIGCALPIAGESQARDLCRVLRREFPDATHQCWALRVRTREGERELHDDAGEPAGTAGLPILQALRRAGVTNALVVVVRYFGGQKLGKGGLARAYRETARQAIAAAGLLEIVVMARLRLSGPLVRDGEVRRLVARHEGRVVDATYGEAEEATFIVEVPEGAADLLRAQLGVVCRGSWKAADGG